MKQKIKEIVFFLILWFGFCVVFYFLLDRTLFTAYDFDMLWKSGNYVTGCMVILFRIQQLMAAFWLVKVLKEKEVRLIDRIYSLSLLTVSVLVASINTRIALVENIRMQSRVFLVVAAWGVFLFGMVGYFALRRAKQREYIRMQNELLKAGNSYKEQEIERIEELYQKTKILKHDMKHYLTMILREIESEQYEQVQKDLKQILKKELSAQTITYLSSSTINAVLNDKIEACKWNHIQFMYQISGTVLPENEIKVAVILSNLLDNAIEAEKKEKEAHIELKIFEVKEMLYITVKNCLSQSVLKENGELQTTKQEQENHGYGVKSVKMLVNEMDGIYECKEENHEFVITILLPNRS